MGGQGSDRYHRWHKKTTTDKLIQIDVREWNQRLLRSNFYFSRTWSVNGNAIFRLTIDGLGQELQLRYALERLEGLRVKETKAIVELAFTTCNFGGERPWFLCPNLLCLKRRVAKLYFGERGFLCRNCCQLTYRCQQGSAEDRALRRIQEIKERLRLPPGRPDSSPLQRPKWMRRRVFAALQEKHQESLKRLRGAAHSFGVLRSGSHDGMEG